MDSAPAHTRIAYWKTALACALIATGCGRPEPELSLGSAEATVLALSAADVAMVSLTVTGSGISQPIQTNLAGLNGRYGALIGMIPAGSDRLFSILAKDSSGTAIYAGQASGVTILAGQTTTVLITAQQLDQPVSFHNAVPIIDALTVGSRQVEPGAIVPLSAAAHDPNPQDTLTLAWSANGGRLAEAAMAATTWTAPVVEGTYELTFQATDNRGARSASTLTIRVAASNGRGVADVQVKLNTWPTVKDVSATLGWLDPQSPTTLVATAVDPDGDPLDLEWTSGCAGTFTAPTAATTTFRLDATETATSCVLLLSASDGRGGVTSGSLTLAVGAPKANVAPTVLSFTQSAMGAAQGQTIALAVSAQDPEGGSLAFAWTATAGALSDSVSADGQSQILWTAPTPEVDATVSVTVTDTAGATTTQAFAIAAIASVFTIAVLPDTQVYSEDPVVTPVFAAQVNWILANQASQNIVFVSHEGDVVDNGRDSGQWSRAMASLAPLLAPTATLPFSINRGNHDDVDYYRANLPASLYHNRAWSTRVSPNGLNNAVIFPAAGRAFAHLGINKDPSLDELAWASMILDTPEFQGLPTIVTTHDYLVPGGRDTNGDLIWNNLVNQHPQIFMVLNGHTHTEYQMVSHNAANRPVYQMLADYQDRGDGGSGLMRLITVDIPAGTIAVKTFSPGYTIVDKGVTKTVAASFETDADSQFTYQTNLVERFHPGTTYDFGTAPAAPALPPPATITAQYSHIFQQRRDGYQGTVDTQINENNAWLDYAGEATVTTDLDDSGSRVQSLLQFKNIIGAQPGQIPAGATITSAKLYFTVTSSTKGNINLHRLLVPFTEQSRWIDFTPVDAVRGAPTMVSETFYDPSGKVDVTHTIMQGGGVEANDVEAMSTVDATFTCLKGFSTPFIVDVTTSVQAWANGQTNLGWVFRNNSTDGWDFYTGEGQSPAALVVVVQGAPLVN